MKSPAANSRSKYWSRAQVSLLWLENFVVGSHFVSNCFPGWSACLTASQSAWDSECSDPDHPCVSAGIWTLTNSGDFDVTISSPPLIIPYFPAIFPESHSRSIVYRALELMMWKFWKKNRQFTLCIRLSRLLCHAYRADRWLLADSLTKK